MTAPVLAALISVQVLFGLNYVISKVVVGAFPPLIWASIRAITTAITLIVAATILKRPRPRLTRDFVLPMIGCALLAVSLNQGLFLMGLKLTTSINSSVLNTTIPIFTLALVTLFGQEKLTPRRACGFVLSLSGVLILRRIEDINLSDATLVGDILTVLNCLCYSLFLSTSRKFVQKHDAVWLTAYLFAFGSIPLTLASLPSYAEFHLPAFDAQLVACMAFAIVGGTLMTYFLNLWALKRARSSAVALFGYLQPIVTAALAWAWMGEVPSMRTAIASLIIFSGMLLGVTGA